ncbi:unnamed protein product [Clavelina lepadiformis]|uniref:G-patch domain-containing protein n=1 Tax=Clavelina lepadiformis TaxID=159417 RepID=A0ABP0FME9_CLALP
MSVKTSLSFGFKKKIESKVDISKVINEAEAQVDPHEEDAEIKKKREELVIPLIQKNRWCTTHKDDAEVRNDVKQSKDNLDEKAAQEIMKESEKFLEKRSIEDEDKEFEKMQVPLLMKNKVPEGFETDDKLNVSLRPEESSLTDYDAIPIEAFGMAMLRGMGWDPNVGIGKTFKQNTKMLETVVRPKGLGLGAAANPNLVKKGEKKSSKEEQLELKKGVYVQVISGSNKRKYGVIEGIDADNAQCLVRFALGGSSATVAQYALDIVTKSDYLKFGKDLSRLSKAFEIQEKLQDHADLAKNGDNQNHDESASFKHVKKRRHCDESHPVGGSAGRHQKERKLELTEAEQHKHAHEKSAKKQSKEKQHHKKTKKKRNTLNDDDDQRRKTWLQPHLRVRMVDRNYRKGKFYREKMIVVDVLDSKGRCCCRSEKGNLLDDIHEDMLETVVPRSNSDAYVKITSKGKSKHDGKLARILEKDKESCEVYLQLIEKREVALRMSFDDICEYIGDIEADSMF